MVPDKNTLAEIDGLSDLAGFDLVYAITQDTFPCRLRPDPGDGSGAHDPANRDFFRPERGP